MENNPYVGPRSYERGDRHNFFGRDRDARDLIGLIMAERVVLFYAQSGAGKTSLLNAQVIPALEEEGFHMLPVARVGSDLPPSLSSESVPNIFVFSVLMALAGEDIPPEVLPEHTLLSFLRLVCLQVDEGVEPRPPLLILDQFEELFTTHHDRWQDARGFFLQVREALDALPNLGVVIAMREDRIAQLDPYASLLPRRLGARFRMERLGPDEALEAVVRPASNAGCPFDPGAAERLVDDLRRIKGFGEAEKETAALGPYVEPVQLQVVCNRLWDSLPEQMDHAIQWEEVQQYGNIDQALTDFYEGALNLARISEPSQGLAVSERQLRHWFSEQLITPTRTRGLVLRGKGETAGLPNAAVDVLEARHLIRADVRAGARWYELVHDRLVDPILKSNQAWEAARRTPLRATAERWQAVKSDALLYRDKALKEAMDWKRDNPDEVEPYEQEFLAESQRAEQGRTRRRRLYMAGAIAGILVLAAMALLTVFALAESHRAEQQSEIAFSREVAAQALRYVAEKQTDLALLLSTEAFTRTGELWARGILLEALQGNQNLVSVLRGHTDEVMGVAFSPDGMVLASASQDKTIHLWDVATGQPHGAAQGRLTGHTSWVRSVAFSSDGNVLASGSGDNTIRLWDLRTGKLLDQPLTHTGYVLSVAFSPNGQVLASGSDDKAVRLWDVATGQALTPTRASHTSGVTSVAFSPDGKLLASGSDDKTVRLWDVATGKPLTPTRTSHTSGVTSVAFSPDGKRLASGSQDRTIRLWDVATGQPVGQPFMRHTDGVTSVAFSPDGKVLASGSKDKTIRLWDVAAGQPFGQPLTVDTSGVTSVAFSPDGKTLASGCGDSAIRLWDVTIALNTGVVASQPLGKLIRYTASTSMAFSPDGKVLALGGDGTIRLWDAATGQPSGPAQGRLTGHTKLVYSVAFSPDGKWLASGSEDKTVRLWDVVTGQPFGQPLTHTTYVRNVVFSPDGRVLASVSCEQIGNEKPCGQGEIRLWDVATGQPHGQPITVQANWGYSPAFSSDGKWVAAESLSPTSKSPLVRLWDVATGQPRGQPITLDVGRAIKSLAFSPDGKVLASGDGDKTISLWDVSTGQLLAQPRTSLTKCASQLTFSRPDGKILASAGDGVICLWDAITGRPLGLPLTGHAQSRRITSMASSPDGNLLASSDALGFTILWDTSIESWLARARRIVGRNMTDVEWKQHFRGKSCKTCEQLPPELIESPTPTARPTATAVQGQPQVTGHILAVPYKSQNDPDGLAQNNDDGPACIAMILSAQDRDVRTDAVYAASGVNQDRPLTFDEIRTAAAKFDLSLSWKVGASLDDIRGYIDRGTPVIALVKYEYLPDRQGQATTGGHFVLVVGYDDDGGEIVINDPYYWGNLRSKGDRHRYDYATWEQAWGRANEDGNPNRALLIPQVARPVATLAAPIKTSSTPAPTPTSAIPTATPSAGTPSVPQAPAWPYGKVLTGVGMGSPQSLTSQELKAIATGKVEAVKVFALPDPDETKQLVQQIRAIRPDMFIIAQLFIQIDLDNKPKFSPQDFVDTVMPGFEVLYQVGVRYFEIHLEPNHPNMGMGWNWRNGAEFGAWFLQVQDLLKQRHKDTYLGFPGLSPQPNVPDFLDGATPFIAQADWVGVHCYWQTPDQPPYPMTADNAGMYWRGFRSRYPDKLLMITEFSNNNPNVDYVEKGQQYARYFQLLRNEPNLGAAFAFALNWPGQDVNHEGWVSEGNITGIPGTLGALISQPGFLDPITPTAP